jgi:two-component system chemotaxis sensor kinase CheA
VTVGAALRGDRLVVTVADDGAGIDVAAVRQALHRAGREVPEDDRGVARALLTAGVSTRGEATAISGRGVGLDAVRAAVERVGGSVDVEWSPGEGTTFVLVLPVSIATVRALLVSVGGRALGIPSAAVERAIRVRPGDARVVDGRAVLPAASGTGAPVPLVSLAHALGWGEAPAAPDGVREGVLVQHRGRRVALLADDLLDERELVVRPVEHVGAGVATRVVGAALIGGSRVAVVLSPSALVDAALRPAAGAAPPPLSGGGARVRRRILVVDDSITTRTLEESVLAAAGFDVVTAVDGVDAWRVIERGGIELVVADIEMPRLDGIALCERIRESRTLATLPVILVTSLDRPEQRARGLEAGADAYITKSSFDQDALIATVRQLLDEREEA